MSFQTPASNNIMEGFSSSEEKSTSPAKSQPWKEFITEIIPPKSVCGADGRIGNIRLQEEKDQHTKLGG